MPGIKYYALFKLTRRFNLLGSTDSAFAPQILLRCRPSTAPSRALIVASRLLSISCEAWVLSPGLRSNKPRDVPTCAASQILKTKRSPDGWQYFIHYHKWDAKWDEWVGPTRLMPMTDENRAKAKQNNESVKAEQAAAKNKGKAKPKAAGKGDDAQASSGGGAGAGASRKRKLDAKEAVSWASGNNGALEHMRITRI